MTEDLVNVEKIDVSTNPAGGCIEIWTLNRPNRLNALNRATHKELIQACDKAESDDSVRVIVITGAQSDPEMNDRSPRLSQLEQISRSSRDRARMM